MNNEKLKAYREIDNIIQELREEHPEQVFWSLAMTCIESAVHELIAEEAKKEQVHIIKSIRAKRDIMKELKKDELFLEIEKPGCDLCPLRKDDPIV